MTRINMQMNELPDEALYILPVKNVVVFPNVIFPLSLENPDLIEVVNDALVKRQPIGIFTELERQEKMTHIFKVGTKASILKMFHMPDGSIRLLVQGIGRVKIKRMIQKSPVIIGKMNGL